MSTQKENQKIKKSGLRQFSLTSLAVDNGISVILLAIMIILFGYLSYVNMPKEQYPEITLPQVYVNTPYFGNSAKDIEDLVTRPIEKELQTVDGVKDITSTSMQDFSVVIVEYDYDVDIDVAVRRTKDAVDLASSELPDDLDEEPLVEDINFAEFPIFTVNLSGNFTNDELRSYAEYLQDEIEDLPEITRVEIKGALEREVKIDVDVRKMESMEVNFGDIAQAIQTENITMSGGEVLSNNFRRAIRVVGEFENIDQIRDLIVKAENQKPVYLRDIAEVSFGFKDRTTYARADKNPVVALDVIKKSGKNLLFATDEVKKILQEAQERELPESLQVSIFNDQSVNTRNTVTNLENSIISGIILVTLVLLFFLGIRNATFVGLAIPLSMLMGIMILNLTGTTMNIVVLFSLILALGLLVDNAIVVVENIYRYMQNGYSGKDAAKYGTGEVALPIIASTATTLAAFAPLAFWPGIMGGFMKYMPLTLIIVLSSSLFVALVINPVLTSRFMKVDEKMDSEIRRKRKRRNYILFIMIMVALSAVTHLAGIMWLGNLLALAGIVTFLNVFVLRPGAFAFQKTVLPWLENVYDKFIAFALRIPFLVFGGTFFLLIFSTFLLSNNSPKVEFFPSADPLYVNVFVEMPLGTDIDATNELVYELETKIVDMIEANDYGFVVEDVLSQIGENTSDPNNPPEPGVTPHKGRITVSFVPTEEREGVSTYEIMEDIREVVLGNPGVQITVDKNAEGPPTGKPINLELRGEDINVLSVLAEDVIAFLNAKNIPGIEELQTDVKLGKPEMIIEVDREQARRFGFSTFAVADAIRTAVFGKEVSKYKVGEDEYDIFVRLNEEERYDIQQLLAQKITFLNQKTGATVQVPISAVADIQYTSTYSSIKRRNLDRVVTVFSNVLEGYNANEIVAELDEIMADYDLPAGYSYEFTGEQEQQAEDMGFLTSAFMVAIFAIFLIIVAQFNSVISPFIIILSVVFSLIGVLLGHVITGQDIVIIMTGVGIISLAGVVVNNAIVLIDYTNLVIKRKQDEKQVASMFDLTKEEIRECVIKSGGIRLRPVLLTAITTVLGLIPLAVGININFFTLISELDANYFVGGDNVAFWGPMAWTIIYGMIFATFLTLIVVPVMYWLAYRMVYALRSLFSVSSSEDPTPSPTMA